ncbi:glycosyltransferase family 2 protein [Paraburkholderia sp. BL17N1]|uniref:glycosyltransferase family 2 protein n=1 Tax=Paraburkholderia sp. BL17N1 TaxID=1938798 RepID=UPI000EAD6C16|nr:glycosyltransferase family 2 protein [Paraburkholderia sp. BL17N1]RKR42925.1 GT2 family glycosyltransferase [Paraburkholderia sp. BL17N1]
MNTKFSGHQQDAVSQDVSPDKPLSSGVEDARGLQARVAQLEKQLGDALNDGESIAKLNNRILKLEVEQATLLNSTSWRVTAPLRSVSRIAAAVRLAFSTIGRQAEVRGGLGSALGYYASVIGREGLPGVVARVRRLKSGRGFADGPPRDEVYHEWISQYDTVTPDKQREIEAEIALLARKPLISVVVPTYNSDERLLREMVASVQTQIYPHWELCIADDASTQPHVKAVLQELAAADSRIKVVFRETNGHISEASNSALALATGEYVALLDHDDLLPPHALYMVARYINLHPQGRMFYSDEDKLTTEGTRTTPYFKCDWNPQLFLTQNMFSHLGVFETKLVQEAGGFRKGFEGSQDYDLALRCVELAGDDSVIHIPHVLYHWRIVPGSTAGSGSEKPYALIAAIRAVEDHLKRAHLSATVEHRVESFGVLRVRYTLPNPQPKVSIIIPTRDGLALLKQCLDSIFACTLYQNFEIIIVDNGSVQLETMKYFDEVSQRPNVRVLRDESPFNFSALNNHAARVATGEFLCLLNNDIEVISPDWLNEMVSLANLPRTGAVGACLWYPTDALQHGGVVIGLGGIAGHMHHKMKRGHFGYFGRAVATQNLSAVTAACLVVKKSVYDEVGGLEETLAVAFNDVDFCMKLVRAGYRNIWTPHAEMYHHESATRGSDLDPEKYERFVSEIRRMEARWEGCFERDPAYNPNLSLSGEAPPFTLASPPRIGQFE